MSFWLLVACYFRNSRLETKLEELGKSMANSMETINSTLQSLVTAIKDLSSRLETSQSDNSSVFNSSVHSVDSVAVLPNLNQYRLTAEQRSILSRSPVVSSDVEQNDLLAELGDSGRDGAFFRALVKTLSTDRIMNKSDAKKTANGVLRAVYDESYLAERVTMAGYRRCKLKT